MSEQWSWFFGWTGVFSLVLALPLSIVGTMLTPAVQAWLGRRSRHRMAGRLHLLINRGQMVEEFSEHPIKLVSFVGIPVLIGLMGSTGIAYTSFLFLFSLGYGGLVASSLAARISADTFRVVSGYGLDGLQNNSYTPATDGLYVVAILLFVSLLVTWISFCLAFYRLTVYTRLPIEEIENLQQLLAVDNSPGQSQ